MLAKIFVPILFLAAQFMVSWYGYFTGKLSTKGTYLGFSYDSVFVRAIIVQLEYIWVIIIINILFTLGFQFGFANYKNFLVLIILWIASGPIAALIFNAFFAKEKLDIALIAGIVFVTIGAVFVVAHKEITQLFQ